MCDGHRLVKRFMERKKSQKAAVNPRLGGFIGLTGSCGSQLLHCGILREGQVNQMFCLKIELD